MGETNDAATKMIAAFVGQEPQMTINDDGTMSLHLGHIVMTARYAMWSDPSAYLYPDGSLLIAWGAQSITLPAITKSD